MPRKTKNVLEQAVDGDIINLDEVQKRHPSTVTDDELRMMVRMERRSRAVWNEKQKGKGREENEGGDDVEQPDGKA